MKLTIKATTIRIMDGRKLAAKIDTTLNPSKLEGIVAGADMELPLDELIAAIEAAVAEAAKRKGSVVPDDYRYRYGVDQNCGDAVALALTAKVTTPAGVDVEACREVAEANGVGDRFDVWMVKGLNPGMIRMNLGNVLRGKVRRDEPVMGLGLATPAQPEA